MKKAKFEVKLKKVDKKVTVKSPKAEKTTIKLSKKGTTIKTATIGLHLSNGEWKGSQYFGNTDWYAGKWTVSQLVVRYIDGECVILSKDNNTLTQGLKNIKITVTTKPVGESGDSKFPSVTGI